MDWLKTAENMKARGFTVRHYTTGEQAAKALCEELAGQEIGMGGSMTATTQLSVSQTPSKSRLSSQKGVCRKAKPCRRTAPHLRNHCIRNSDGTFAPATVIQNTPPSRSSIRGMPVFGESRILSMRSVRLSRSSFFCTTASQSSFARERKARERFS